MSYLKYKAILEPATRGRLGCFGLLFWSWHVLHLCFLSMIWTEVPEQIFLEGKPLKNVKLLVIGGVEKRLNKGFLYSLTWLSSTVLQLMSCVRVVNLFHHAFLFHWLIFHRLMHLPHFSSTVVICESGSRSPVALTPSLIGCCIDVFAACPTITAKPEQGHPFRKKRKSPPCHSYVHRPAHASAPNLTN